MTDEMALRDVLMALVSGSKNNYIMISAALAELAAAREILSSLDPTFADVLEKKRQQAEAERDSVAKTVIGQYDAIIQGLKDGDVC